VAHKLVGPGPVDFDVALAQMAPMPLQGPVPVLGPLEADKAFAVAPALGAQAQGDATAAKKGRRNKNTGLFKPKIPSSFISLIIYSF
jgi:hypothetical protein